MTPAGDGSQLDSDAIRAILEVVDESRTGIVVASPDGTVVYRNAAARSPSGSLVSDILVAEAVDENLRAALTGELTRQTLDLFGPPRLVLTVTANPLPSGGAVARIEDVSERHFIDAVRTDFVANISHELKTPVGALSVLAETISQADDAETVARLAERMVAEADRVARTIDDLLELSRIELGSTEVRERIEIGSVVDEARERVAPLSERSGVVIDIRLPERSPVVMGKRRELVSAVGNLLENAVKYSDPKGRVRLVVEVVEDKVEIRVSDDGPGIPHQDLDRIFERFYRVDRARSRETGGTGLGLSIVRHVATNHGGDVEVASAEGEGATFTLRIPIGKRTGQGSA